MIEAITEKILNFIIKKEAIDDSKSDTVLFYKYGIEITISSIFNILIIAIISVFFNCIDKGILFLIVFIPTRQFTGGFHANTYFKCNLTLAICYSATLALSNYASAFVPLELSALVLFVEICFILNYCPIRNEHKQIDSEKQYKKCKIIGTVLFSAFGVAALILIYLKNSFGNIIIYTLHLIAVLCIVALLFERRKHYEKAE